VSSEREVKRKVELCWLDGDPNPLLYTRARLVSLAIPPIHQRMCIGANAALVVAQLG
jgi:hypothetical protein